MDERKYRELLLHVASLLAYIDARFPRWEGRYLGEVQELREWLAAEKGAAA